MLISRILDALKKPPLRRFFKDMICVSFVLSLGFGLYIWIWTGYRNVGSGFDDKTLWDWIGILLIPTILAFGAFLFNESRKVHEHRLALDQQREDALQNYLENMVELLLKEKLIEKKDIEDDPTINVAHVRTITTLRILDTKRKNIVFQFLRDAKLADFLLVGASLRYAELSHTSMDHIRFQSAELSGANLSGANLSGADLCGADLFGADLSGANLYVANLSEATLSGANLRGVNLRNTNLSGSSLYEANLSGAIITDKQLFLEVISLEGAIMPDGTRYHEQFDDIEDEQPEDDLLL